MGLEPSDEKRVAIEVNRVSDLVARKISFIGQAHETAVISFLLQSLRQIGVSIFQPAKEMELLKLEFHPPSRFQHMPKKMRERRVTRFSLPL